MVVCIIYVLCRCISWCAFVLSAIDFVRDKKQEATDGVARRQTVTTKNILVFSTLFLIFFTVVEIAVSAFIASFAEEETLQDLLAVLSLLFAVSVVLISSAIDTSVKAIRSPRLKIAGLILTLFSVLSVVSYYVWYAITFYACYTSVSYK